MRDRVSRRYREKKSLVGTFGITGLFAYLTEVIQGYIRGFTGDHKMIKRVGRLLLPTTAFVLVCFIIYMSAPILPQLKKEAEIVAGAQEEAARITQRANKEIELEKSKMKDEVKKEMISVASMMAGKFVAESMDDKKQAQLVDEALKEIGDDTWRK